MIFDWFFNLFKSKPKDYEIIFLEEISPINRAKPAVKKPAVKKPAKKRVPAKGIVAAKKKAVKKVTK